MELYEVIVNPAVLAFLGSLVVSGMAYLQWRSKRKDSLGKTEKEIEEQKEYHLIWYAEMYHKLRSACGTNHGWDIVDSDRFPLFPPDVMDRNEK